MAVYTTTTSGLWSAWSTWVGWVKPPSGAWHSIIIAVWHTVTYDEAAGVYGDDTATAFAINGTLKASRTTSTSLTVRGKIYTNASTSATIDYWRKSTSDLIPAWVTATLILNDSAALANFKWWLYVWDTSNAYFWGTYRKKNTTLVSGISAWATSCVVADATWWAIGDEIILAETTGTYNQHDRKTITWITPWSGTTATITFTAVTYDHAANCPVGNFSSNVTIKSINTTNPAYICFRHTSTTTSNNRRELNNVALAYVWSDQSDTNNKVFVSSWTSWIASPFLEFDSVSAIEWNTNVLFFLYIFVAPETFKITNLATFSPANAWPHFYSSSWTSIQFENCVGY